MDLVLNNLQRLIYHKTKPAQTKQFLIPNSIPIFWLQILRDCIRFSSSFSLSLFNSSENFLLLCKRMVFRWSVSDNNSSQVSRTLLSILADLSNAVLWMHSTCPLISKSSNPLTKYFGNHSKCTNYSWYHRHHVK